MPANMAYPDDRLLACDRFLGWNEPSSRAMRNLIARARASRMQFSAVSRRISSSLKSRQLWTKLLIVYCPRPWRLIQSFGSGLLEQRRDADPCGGDFGANRLTLY